MAKLILLGRGAWERGQFSAEGFASVLKGANIKKDGGVSLPSLFLSLKLQVLRQLENSYQYLKKERGIEDLSDSLSALSVFFKDLKDQKLALRDEAKDRLKTLEKGTLVGTLFGQDFLAKEFPTLSFFPLYEGAGQPYFDFSFAWQSIISLEAQKALLRAYPDVLRKKIVIEKEEKPLKNWVWNFLGGDVEPLYPQKLLEKVEEKIIWFGEDPFSEADLLIWSGQN